MEDDKVILQAVADYMKAHAAVAYLVSLGVPEGRLSQISYGKEKPLCTDGTEACWSMNRRDHFAWK